MNNETLKKDGYKYQIGFYAPNGNYTRFAVTENRPSDAKLAKIAEGTNCAVGDLSVQVIQ